MAIDMIGGGAAEFWAAMAVAVPVILIMLGIGAGLGEMAWRIDRRSGRSWGLLAALGVAIPLAIGVVAVIYFLVPLP